MENFPNDNNYNNSDNVLNEQPVFFEANNGNVKTNNPKANKSCNNFKGFFLVFACVCLSLIIGAASGFISAKYVLYNDLQSDAEEKDDDSNSQIINITVDETVNSSVEAVAKKVNPSVVGIRTTAAVQSFFGGSSESTGEGSGVIYTDDGYIITNYHVIESAVNSANSTIEVFLKSDLAESYEAIVVGYNISYDLAVIKIEKQGLDEIEIADSTNLNVGEYCVAIGAPGGLEYMGSVTNGIISGLNRKLALAAYDDEISLIQTDTAINPGNSGGALVNLKGQLIGVNSSKIVSESFEGMGFAIPSNTVVDICDKIIAKENDPDPYVGITFSDSWTPERLKQYGYPVGAVVSRVIDGGPAYSSGIRNGDIITEFNGNKIEDIYDFNDLLASTKPGDTVAVKFYRSGRTYSTAIIVGSNNAQ